MSAVYNSTVQGFYLSYYGRPADPAGLTFWTGQLSAAGGNLSAILNAFGTSAEATRRYGTGTNASKIEAIYQQTFGRAADPVGLAFYEAELAAGRMTLIDASKRIIDGATGPDVAVRTNRLSAAQSFTDKLDTDAEKAGYSGSGAEDAARTWIRAVTGDAATVTAAVATADSTITSLLPQTFTLTTNQDKWTGSAGNDTAAGGTSTLSASDTLGITDQIDGGAGTDTISLAIGKGFAGFQTDTGFMKSVEVVNLTNSSATAYSFATRGITGVEQYNISGPVSVTGMDSLATKVSIKGIDISSDGTATAITVSHADTLTSGSSDKMSLSIEGLGRASSSTTNPFDFSTGGRINLTVPAIETLAVTATGTNVIQVAGSSSLKDLSFDGAGSVTLDSVPATLRTVDASAVKGVARVNLSGQNAAAITSVKTGEGADLIRYSVEDAGGQRGAFRADATIDGGAGADTLNFVPVAGRTHTAAFNMFNVETLSIADTGTAANSGALTFSGSSVKGLQTISVGTTSTGAHSITGMGSDPLTLSLTVTSSTDQRSTPTIENTGAATLTVAPTSASSAQTALDNVTFSKATSLAVSLPLWGTFAPAAGAIGISAPEATSVTISGAGRFNQAWVGNTDTGLSIPKATSLTIDQTGTTVSTSPWNIGIAGQTTPALKNLTVTTAATDAAGVVLSSAAEGTTQAFRNLETLKVTTANHFQLRDVAPAAYSLPAITSVDLSGAGNNAQVTLGALGSSTLGYGISVKASALKGGLTVGNIDVGSGQTISVDLTGKQAKTSSQTDTTIGALRVNSDTTAPSVLSGTINLNANGMKSEAGLSVSSAANIHAKSVTIDASGSDVVTLRVGSDGTTAQTITGETVVVKAPNSATTFSVGNFVVKDSLTLVDPSTVSANGTSAVLITAGTGSTALVVDITGSLQADTYTVTGVSTTTSITVKGNLGDNTDTVTITAPNKTTGTVTINTKDLVSGNANITGSARADTITAGAGDDIIVGSAGADTIDGGAGKDLIRYDQFTQASAALTDTTGFARSGVQQAFLNYQPRSLDTISTANMDKINGFSRTDGDTVNFSMFATSDVVRLQNLSATNLGTGKNVALSQSSGANTEGAGKMVMIPGTWASDVFTVSDGGNSTLFLATSNGTTFDTGNVYGIVLVGYSAAGTWQSSAPASPYADYTGLLASSLIA